MRRQSLQGGEVHLHRHKNIAVLVVLVSLNIHNLKKATQLLPCSVQQILITQVISMQNYQRDF
jgi:hypothetical protein